MEKQGFKFVGPRDEHDPQKVRAIESLQEDLVAGRQKMEGELEKTEIQLEAIRTVNQIITSIFRELNLESNTEIDPDQIHFLNTEGIKSNQINDHYGVYTSQDDSIYINSDNIGSDTAKLIAILLHESLHAVSYKYFYSRADDEGNLFISNPKTGFRTVSWKNELVMFRGLNEFFVENMVYQALNNAADSIKRRFDVDPKVFKERRLYAGGGLDTHGKFFVTLINEIEKSGVVDSDFTSNVAKAHFEGTLKVLKPVEDFFGKGSLRVLGFLDAFLGNEEKNNNVNELVKEYFLHADENRKREIIENLSNIEEELNRTKMICRFKEKGIIDPGAILLYKEWCRNKEKNVTDYITQHKLEFEKARLFIETDNQECIDYVYNEILDPMTKNGEVFFEENPELKVLLDEFYE